MTSYPKNSIPLTAGVGRNEANRANDVRRVQALLNANLPAATSLPVNGVCTPATIAAIRRFQARAMRLAVPDGIIATGGPTWRALAGGSTQVAAPPSHETIPAPIVAAAQAAAASCGVPACISIAQWILESGRGAHMPCGSNNPFGIKAIGAQPYVISRTREVFGGKSVTINARFRKFASIADAFAEHGRLLATAPAYRAAMLAVGDPDLFAERLTGTYATDPNYGATLQEIMREGDLYRYDVAADTTAPFRSPRSPDLS
jgi:hypothetical protein